ncbi:MAG: HEAT repeat domain-containing protein [Woeseiaceae bacterium]
MNKETKTESAIPLDDEQIRQFICDGILVIHSDEDTGFHQSIRDKIERIHRNGGDTGNNILPQVPDLQRVLDAPAISGAMQGVLGENYMQYPHRILVPSEPLTPEQRNIELRGDEDGPPMGEGSQSYSYWHKDTYPPLGRARYHVPRFLFLFYFPQDTPAEMGPTRMIPGTHYQDQLAKEDHAHAYVPDHIKAGSCVLASFDIEHAGMSNRTDQTRYMVKFVFRRTEEPLRPSWNGGADDWRPPGSHLGRFENNETWSYVWDWMRGHERTAVEPAKDIDSHIGKLNGTDQKQRLAAIYSLGAMGEAALGPLLESLLSVAGKNHIKPPYRQKADGSIEAIGDSMDRRWTEGGYIFRDEAFALGCLGDLAVDPLIELLDHDDPWIVINAAFALSQIGSRAARAMQRLAMLLASPDHRVVRAVLEAIACIGSNTIAAWPALKKLLQTKRDAWEQDLELDYLVGDQIHLNAVDAILQSDLEIEHIEALLIDLLEKPAAFSHVPATAAEILLRRGSPIGRRQALQYLQAESRDKID